MDVAGNGGPPFAGGRENIGGRLVNFSMERRHPVLPGDDPNSWRRCDASEGSENVNPPFRDIIIATPGETNYVNLTDDTYPEPDNTFRSAN